ncbi:MAG: hypothetical protein U0R19_02045 [Bryobacteraceae bacterium]
MVETNGIKLANQIAAELGASITFHRDDARKSGGAVPLLGGQTFQIAMARSENFLKAGGKPHITPASIHEDLRCRDFTINSIALSLGKASKGLLLDPTNGLGDLERRELRAVSNYSLYDDPVRLWRLIRLKVRLGFEIEERTLNQYRNAREAQMERFVPPRALFQQLRATANELNPGDVLKAFEDEKLLPAVSPALTGPKLNLQGFAKLQKARINVPFGIEFAVDNFSLFLQLITEKLTPKERSAMMKAIEATRAEADCVAKLEARAKKLESTLKSAKLVKPSQVYNVLAPESGESLLLLLMRSQQRIVVDRIRNYLQKYLLAAMEVTDKDIEAEGLKPGTPKFKQRKAEKVKARLDARPKKVPPPAVPEPVPVAAAARGRL